MKIKKYFLTYHAVERFKERFENLCDENIKNWTRKKHTDKVKPFFDKLLENTEENKLYLNDSIRMIHLYEKYGYDTEYKFLENIDHNILFILAKERKDNHFTLVTLVNQSFHSKNSLSKMANFSNIEKKEDRKKNELLNKYEKIKKELYDFEKDNLNIFERLRDLEKQNQYDILHKESLQSLLFILYKSGYFKKIENEYIFKSENFEYNYQLENNIIKINKITNLNDEDKILRQKHIKTLIKLDENDIFAQVIEKINDNEEKKEYLDDLNHIKYTYIKHKITGQYKIIFEQKIDLENIERENFKNKILMGDFNYKIKDKIKENKHIKLEDISLNKWKGLLILENIEIIFNYNESNNKIEVETLKDYINDLKFKSIILEKIQNNKTRIIQKIDEYNKIRLLEFENKEYKISYNSKNKELNILEVKKVINKENEDLLPENFDFDLISEILNKLDKNNVEIIDNISSSFKIRTVKIKDMEYTFSYSSKTKEVKILEKKKLENIIIDENKYEKTEYYLNNSEIFEDLNNSIKNEEKESLITEFIYGRTTCLEKISNTRSLHEKEVDNQKYIFLIHKKKNEEINIKIFEKIELKNEEKLKIKF